MVILDRYVLKLWLAPFLGFFLVITGLLLFGRTLRVIQAFGDNPIESNLLLAMLLAIMPYFLTLTIPFAFFFALLKVLSYLQQNSEADALLAAGISPFRLLRPMLILAVMLWLFLTWTAMQWMPAGQKAFNLLYQAVKETSAMPNFAPQQFTQGFEGLTIYHVGEDELGNMKHFMLEDKREIPPSIYLAKEAKIQRQDHFLVLNMRDGVHLEGKDAALRSTYFTTFSLAIDVEDIGVVKITSDENIRPSMMDMSALTQMMQSNPSIALQAEWHRRWLLPSTIFILLLFALPLSTSTKRSGKSRGWIWGVALLLMIYNVQIALHKQVVMAKLDWWAMWVGQLGFMIVGFILLLFAVKYNHFDVRSFIYSIFKQHGKNEI